MLNFRNLLWASAALLPALPAAAQTADPELLVVSATGVEQPADETGRSVTVLDREEIERRQTVTLADLLATTPGVTVTRNGGVGGVTSVSLRGADAAQTLVLIDGVRVNDPSSPAGAFDFGNLLAGSIERVEVLRGANSVAWGSQAIGGVVNVVTETPGDVPSLRANAEYGFADSVSANAAVSGRTGILSGALTGGYYRTDGISAAATGTEADGYRQAGASGRIGIAFTDSIALDLRGYFADSRVEIDGFPAPAYRFADTEQYGTVREIYGYAGLNAAFADGRFRNKLAFTIGDIDRDSFDPAVGSAPTYFYRGRTERYLYQGDFALVDQLRVVIGAEHETSRLDDGSTARETGITSVYGELIVSPFDALTVIGGMRYDDHRAFGDATTVSVSGAFEPIAGTRLHASYGESFKAPTLYQLYSAYGTPTLQPEESDNYEAGITQSLIGDALKIGATWFLRDTINQIDFDLLTYTYANIAEAHAEGFEVELVAAPVAGLLLRASYTFVDPENRSPGSNLGKDLARRAHDSASVSVDYRLPLGLSLGGTVTMVGDSFDDPGNFTRLDGYALASVRAEMPVTEQLSVYGRVENLFDAQYRTVAGYGTIGRAAYGGVRLRLD